MAENKNQANTDKPQTNTNMAQSTFLQRSKIETVVADAYEGTKAAVTDYVSTIKTDIESISGEVSAFFKESSNVKKILQSIDFNKPLFGLKIDDAIKALQGLGISKHLIDSLRSVYNDHSFANITSILAGATGVKIFSEAGELYAKVKDIVEYKNLNSFLDLVKEYLGTDFGIDGLGESMETLSFVIDMADKWGLTDIAKKLMEKNKNNPRFKQTLTEQLEVYVSTANLTMINMCLDAGGISPSSARVRCPEAEKMILGAYTIPSNTPLSEYANEGNRLISTIERFANAFPSVQVGIENGQPHSNVDLTTFSLVSNPAVTVLSAANSKYLPCALIGKSYPTSDIFAITTSMYK